MGLKFPSGDIEKLKLLIKDTLPDNWGILNENAYQLKHDGVVVTFFTTTGTLQFQGKFEKAKEYEKAVGQRLFGKDLADQPLVEVRTHSESPDVSPATQSPPEDSRKALISQGYNDSEIVIGLVGAVGTQYSIVKNHLRDRLKNRFRYEVEEIKISTLIIPELPIFSFIPGSDSSHFKRINNLMDVGNNARELSGNNAILALGSISKIHKKREDAKLRKAYIIDSLKHPDEIKVLRETYGQGFYLVGAYSDLNHRTKYLVNDLTMSESEAKTLITRDENDEAGKFGQHTSDAYHLSDFFVDVNYNSEKLKQSIFRYLDIIFGVPHITPLFEEYAMFMAFTASLRSADLSRQVGAVLTKNEDILATGANDIPKYGGGLYWPSYDNEQDIFTDFPQGRDYMVGYDSNVIERNKIIQEILEEALTQDIDSKVLVGILKNSRLNDLIEFGRVVHAEMETLMSCARNNISSKNGILFCTTFPCHNCAKHIVAAGIDKVYFIEPYPKSKALDFHSESIQMGISDGLTDQKFTYFQPFIGVGPRKFFDLFSMAYGSGRNVKRKDQDGNAITFDYDQSKPKVQLLPISYIERERIGSNNFSKLITGLESKTN